MDDELTASMDAFNTLSMDEGVSKGVEDSRRPPALQAGHA
jgi:hypothetical protein